MKRRWKGSGLRNSYDRYKNLSLNISLVAGSYVEYNTKDEMYRRSKEAARCYAAVGNIEMMLNKLYSAINYETNPNT